ncbi:class I SAM-dependent methyltransferase [Vineibacter terrae]|uniref:Class I SAM-dependent methyltransferase n=1 Tax=Vineibacter terrae TaxID=2586908 RepID=A0A5C8PMM6_9HYPH|nr:class I SAM-dependent methyltransferase [Vineibacter terrae]TXL75674.1 class I SAM-dependent methyltransferase [Vineibacter terrae]
MAANANRLQKVVADEALLWGDTVADSYHSVADSHMDGQWDALIRPALFGIPVDMSRCVDFACGRGRNARKLLREGAGHVMMIDVNEENIRFCATMDPGKSRAVLVNGFDLAGIDDATITFFYSFDAMVHFDMEIIASYMPEFHRVMAPGALALLHHSNYDANPGGDFRHNPHMRNFMTARIFKHLSRKCGFEVLRQWTFAWGEMPDCDCITVLRKG